MDLNSFLTGMEGLTEEELDAAIVASPAVHFSTCVNIFNKDGDRVQPVPNILQLRMSEVYERCMELRIPCRMLVLKPRQVGCSTFAAHIIYHHERRYASQGITISDVRENSTKLLEKLGDYRHDDLYPWQNSISTTAKNIRFSHGAFHEIDSAENFKAGIGYTRQTAHFSEVPKWPKTGIKNDKRTMSAVLPSIAKRPGTVVIAEGTPDGAAGWFYDAWQGANTLEEVEAMAARGERKIVWIKVFAAWFEFEEYMRRTPDGDLDPVSAAEREEIERTLSERERAGRRVHHWTYEQIAWRRDIIRTECSGSEDTMDEYYPEDDVRCFLVSGRPRFHMTCLAQQERVAKVNLPEIGVLTKQDNGVVSWNPTPDGGGDILMFEPPREGCRYNVGCDPMTGEDQTQSDDPDRHSIQVWRAGFYSVNRDEWQPAALVARVRAPFQGDADEATGHIERLSLFYGHAICVLEVNMGLHILEHMKQIGLTIYKRKVPDDKPGSVKEQYGFKLKDRNQRRELVETLASAIREGAVLLNDAPRIEQGQTVGLIHECKMFITDHTGKDIGRAGEHDDDVLCAAMCVQTLDSAVEYSSVRRRGREPSDRDQWKVVQTM